MTILNRLSLSLLLPTTTKFLLGNKMKKLICVLVFLIFQPLNLLSQWTQQNSGTSETLFSIYFTDANNGWAVGNNGVILHTTDRGENWVAETSFGSEVLRSVYFSASNNGFIVGSNGGHYTNNSGDSWNSFLEYYSLRDVFFPTQDLGFTVGDNGLIAKTIDGGSNWLSSTYLNNKLNAVYFLSDTDGFIVGESIILKTVDGGSTWSLKHENTDEEYSDIYFADDQVGFAVGRNWGDDNEGRILKTVDGGETWVEQTFELPAITLKSVCFANNNEGWVVGASGTILSTTNGGDTWIKETTETSELLIAVDARNSDTFISGTNGLILFNKKDLELITDWNQSFIEVGSVQTISWNSENIEAINLEYSIDGGRNFIPIAENYPAENGFYNWTVPNTPTLFCLIRISDFTDTNLNDIKPYSDVHEPFYFTIKADNNWIDIDSPTDNNLSKIKFTNDYEGLAWGNKVLLTTNDAGNSWQEKSVFNFERVFFMNQSLGFAIKNKLEDSSEVYKTTDGGTSWSLNYKWFETDRENYGHIEQGKLKGIFFLNDNIGWIHGSQRYGGGEGYDLYLLKTNDGGQSWSVYELGFTAIYIQYLSFINESEGLYYGFCRDCYDKHGGMLRDMVIEKDGISGRLYLITSDILMRTNYHYMHSSYSIQKSFDKTENWIEYFYSTSLFNKYYFLNNDIGWASGDKWLRIPNTNLEFTNDFICMTKDGGQTWELQYFGPTDLTNRYSISDFFSLDGKICWAVGDNGTIIRYGNPSSSTPGVWSRDIRVTDYNQSTNISFGQSTKATSNIDNDLGESELPPPPPLGTFDARFILQNNSSTALDLRNSDDTEIIWTIQFQPSSSGYPLAFVWDKDNLPFGSFFLKDLITGDIVNVDMKLWDNYILTNESINRLQIVYKEQFSSVVSKHSNWDLISVPLAADNMEVTSVFPDAAPTAFRFDSRYVSTDVLENGVGYWVKFQSVGKTNVYGNEPGGSIAVKKGWNIIGPYNQEVSIDQIQTTPSGILTGNFYGFDNGYFIADKLEVGNGYWLKTTQAGEINFNGSASLGKKTEADEQETDPAISFDIIAYDGVSDSITLTFGLDSLATDGYDQFLGEQELPPAPPLGVFDIKILLKDTLISTYTDIRFLAADCYEHLVSYQLGDSAEGLTLSWDLPEGVTLNVVDLFGGSVFNESFESGEGEFTIANPAINNAQLTFCYSDLIVGLHDKDLIPIEYSLSQNYPNPFNPSTRIKFGLPSESKVSLVVYNILGQEVTQLVNQQLKAGYHEAEFNFTNYSSGIYFYRVQATPSGGQAGDYVETKKMILLK